MNAAGSPSTFPLPGEALATMLAACLGVYWLSLLFCAFIRLPGLDTALMTMLLASWATLHATIAWRWRPLAQAVRVFTLRRAPLSLWRGLLKRMLREVSAYGLVIAAFAASTMAIPGSSTPWLAVPALLSLVMCYSVLGLTGRLGMTPRAAGHVVDGMLAGMAVLLLATGQLGAAFDWFTTLPSITLLACTLAWPAMAWRIWRTWHSRMPECPLAAAPVVPLWTRMQSFLNRYSLLRASDAEDARPGAAGKLARLLNCGFLFYLIWLNAFQSVAGLNGTLWRTAALLNACLFLMGKLVVRDLHWRSFLLPGGLQRKRIGSHILCTTLAFDFFLVPLLGAGYVAMRWDAGADWSSIAQALAGKSVLLLEYTCAASAMVIVCSLPARVQKWLGVTAGLLFAALIVAAIWVRIQLGAASVPPIHEGGFNWPYSLSLAAATFLLTMWANRLWTPEKLLRRFDSTPR